VLEAPASRAVRAERAVQAGRAGVVCLARPVAADVPCGWKGRKRGHRVFKFSKHTSACTGAAAAATKMAAAGVGDRGSLMGCQWGSSRQLWKSLLQQEWGTCVSTASTQGLFSGYIAVAEAAAGGGGGGGDPVGSS
jgi:hypothetical protein